MYVRKWTMQLTDEKSARHLCRDTATFTAKSLSLVYKICLFASIYHKTQKQARTHTERRTYCENFASYFLLFASLFCRFENGFYHQHQIIVLYFSICSFFGRFSLAILCTVHTWNRLNANNFSCTYQAICFELKEKFLFFFSEWENHVHILNLAYVDVICLILLYGRCNGMVSCAIQTHTRARYHFYTKNRSFTAAMISPSVYSNICSDFSFYMRLCFMRPSLFAKAFLFLLVRQ